jgi:hypothetical protein
MMFLVYAIIMLDIIVINKETKHLFVKRLAYYSSRLSGREYVSVVLRYNLPTNTPYILGHVVDRESDILVESFAVHSLNISLVVYDCKIDYVLLMIFLANLPDV